MPPRVQRSLVVAAIAGTVLAVFAFTNPLNWGWFPRCLFHMLTGLHCPGCGMSRAVAALSHGDWVAALQSNGLILVMLPVVGYWVVRGETSTLPSRWGWTLLSTVIVFGICRNIPAYPFTLLAP